MTRTLTVVACLAGVAISLLGAGLVSKPPAPIDSGLFVSVGKPGPGIEADTVVGAPPMEVFDALTTSEGVAGFLEVESTIDLRIGGAYELYFGRAMGLPEGQQGSEGCQILSYLPGEMLSFSWNAPPTLPEQRAERTWVVVRLEDAGDGSTRVALTHLGFGEGEGWDKVRAYFEAAWPNVLGALKASFDE